MTKKKIRSMLEHLYGEYVGVVTKLNQTVQTEEGLTTVPLVIEGTVVDMDDSFLMLSDDNEHVKLIAIVEIMVIEQIDPKDPLDAMMQGIKGAIN